MWILADVRELQFSPRCGLACRLPSQPGTAVRRPLYRPATGGPKENNSFNAPRLPPIRSLRAHLARGERRIAVGNRFSAGSFGTTKSRAESSLTPSLHGQPDLRAFIALARHWASSDISSARPMIVADNGSDWFVTGVADARWNDTELNTLKQLKGSDFEVIRMVGVVTR